MSAWTIPLLTALLSTTPVARVTEPAVSPPEDERIAIAWSHPPTTGQTALVAWGQRYHREIRPVLAAWARLLRRLQGQLPGLFESQCDGLVSSLEQLDDSLLLPVPDLLIDLYVRRLLLHLDAAAIACSARELYNVVYRLEEARAALAEVRWLLTQRGLSP